MYECNYCGHKLEFDDVGDTDYWDDEEISVEVKFQISSITVKAA